jgi:hypothetical protein
MTLLSGCTDDLPGNGVFRMSRKILEKEEAAETGAARRASLLFEATR